MPQEHQAQRQCIPLPYTPGDLLRRLLQRRGVTQDALADAMGTSRYSVNQIVMNRRAVTPDMAIRLSRVTGTSVDVWLNLQRDVDLYLANQKSRPEITPFPWATEKVIIHQLPDIDDEAG
jgi:addiction module HigA family antidote